MEAMMGLNARRGRNTAAQTVEFPGWKRGSERLGAGSSARLLSVCLEIN
jgi:hypothetical protein